MSAEVWERFPRDSQNIPETCIYIPTEGYPSVAKMQKKLESGVRSPLVAREKPLRVFRAPKSAIC